MLAEVGKIGTLDYFAADDAVLYSVNAQTEIEQSFDSHISTINDMSVRILTGQPHPRAETLGELANRALVSQGKETRSIAQWAKDLANASFSN